MAVYTKTGDKGKTSNFLGKRISKNSKLINTIGTIDELNSYLGIVGGLEDIQKNLFIINSILSGAKLKFPKNATKVLENKIDKMEKLMPKQTNFLIYGGCPKSCHLYFARAICRRAERAFVAIYNLPPTTYKHILQYINRLSDYLYILARFENFKRGIKEKFWKK